MVVDSPFSQVLRWSMAGWSMLIELTAFCTVYKLVFGDGGNFSLFAGRLVPGEPATMAAILAAVGVPLGYLLYEAYYFVWWTIPGYHRKEEQDLLKGLREYAWAKIVDTQLGVLYRTWADEVCRPTHAPGRAWVGLWSSAIGSKSKDRVCAQLVTEVTDRSPRDLIEYRYDWSLIRSAWYCALSRGPNHSVGYSRAADRFEYLTTMYDGLGALIVANAAAWMAAQALKLWWLAFTPEPDITFAIQLSHPQITVPGELALLLLLVGESFVGYVLFRMMWINRGHLRLSIITLLNSFIRHSDCVGVAPGPGPTDPEPPPAPTPRASAPGPSGGASATAASSKPADRKKRGATKKRGAAAGTP